MYAATVRLRGIARCCLIAVAITAISGCDRQSRSDGNAANPDRAAADGQRIASDYIRAHGGSVDACFLPPPAIRGPGAIQTVSDDGSARPAAVDRLMIAIDSSGSMAGRSGGTTKMEAAKSAAIAFLRAVPVETKVGLLAFGHRGNNSPAGKPESCRGVETIYPVGNTDPVRIEAALRVVKATGWTPLAAAIAQAGRSFSPSDKPGSQVVYIVSDGLETCGGDPVAAARALHQGLVKAIVNIIGFDLMPADRMQLAAVAGAGGGVFAEVGSGGDVARAMEEVRRKARAASAMTTEYFDAGARSTDNNIAVGKFTTDLNFCLARTTSAEMSGLQSKLDGLGAKGEEREAALTMLRIRHERYADRNTKLASDLLAKSKAANDVISAQQHASEVRLRIGR